MNKLKDYVYRAEYSPSDRAICKQCDKNMAKDCLRLCIVQQSRFHDGMDSLWHHPRCFFQRKSNVNVDEIWHFHDLRWKDQLRVRKMAAGKSAGSDSESDTDSEPDEPKGKGKRGSKQEPSSGKKSKKNGDCTEEDHSNVMQAQNEIFWECRDKLANLPKKALQTLLTENGQVVPVASKILDRLTDILVYGAPEKCTVCASESGHIVISADAYHCIGSVTEWAKCDFKTQTPVRKSVEIPPDLLKKYPFLADHAGKEPRERVFPLCFQSMSGLSNTTKNGGQKHKASNGAAKPPTDSAGGPSTSNGVTLHRGQASKKQQKTATPVFNSKLPLAGLKISAVGTLSVKRAELTKIVVSLGGKFVAKVSKESFVLISNESTIAQRPVTLEMAQACAVHVVPVEFLTECQSGNVASERDLVELVERITISTWKTDSLSTKLQHALQPAAAPVDNGHRLSSSDLHRLSEQAKGFRYENSSEVRAQVVVKNGCALDPASHLNAKTHSVYRENGVAYSFVLARTDVDGGSNSFYKMQIIRKDGRDEYHLFRSWGRIGTTVGGDKRDELEKDEAVEQFEYHFMDKTGNEWSKREQFVKKPSKYFIMEMDYGPEETETESAVAPGSNTKLKKPVQDVIRMIFDVEEMKNTMKTFEIDIRKMPLGKMSRKQILEAMSVLSNLQELIQGGERLDSPRIVGASNRFFALIPHDFGMQMPPLLNRINLVKDKLEMLENLLEIEVAFNILRSENKTSTEDPLDMHYEKLKCEMDVMNQSSPEYKQICQYLENTHAATHTEYKLTVVDIFRINRQGEEGRFEPFRKLHNHKLLWHGSRTTNYAGILSQGLRIAPPEAPVTGYMFGKGVYFADMVTKSANYCFVNPSSPAGLLLLSDVALGNMHELTEAKSITRLPPDFHSVKGCGQTLPNPAESVTLPDGVEVPMGHSTASGVQQTSLLYNEYIVYNEAQVHLRYLLKVKFNY